MKKAALFLIIFLPLSINAQDKDIQKLYDNKDYIQLSHLDIENWDINQFPTPLLRAYMYRSMALYEKSNEEIAFLETIDSISQNRDLMAEILLFQGVNYFKNYQYKQSAACYKKLLDDYGDLLGESTEWFQDIYRRYDALSEVKPLQVDIPHVTQISTMPDKKGFPLVQVRTQKDSVSLVFDTGATFSCVTKSVAERLGIRILDYSLMVGGGTGNLESMSIGVADTLYLGDILYKNVVFLVVEDKKLTFPEHDYAVNGTFGFSEMRILPAIKIHKNGVLTIPENVDNHKSNMMFSGDNQMIVQANDTLLLWLDTGAAWTKMSVNYFNKNKEQIEANGKPATKVVNGMGESREFSIYELKNFPVKINTTTTVLPEIPVFIQPTVEVGTFEYDGFLGQDVIKQYDYMLIDFKNMNFSLGNIEHN